jgi:hypothetical protein
MNLPEGTVPRVMNLEVLDDLCATLVEVGPAEPQRAEVTFRKEASGKRKRICQALVQADVVSRMALRHSDGAASRHRGASDDLMHLLASHARWPGVK